MSLIGLRDLDHLLSRNLDEKTLLNLSHVNKYYYTLYDDKFCSDRYCEKYGIKETIDKKTYFENENALKMPKEEGLKFAVINDRADLLHLICSLNGKQAHHIFYMDWTIENDSIDCFKYLFQSSVLESFASHVGELCIIYKSSKILRYLFQYNLVKGVPQKMYRSFINGYPEFVELSIDKGVTQETVNDVVDMLTYSVDDISDWCVNYNEAFGSFARALSVEQIQSIRSLALERDRHHVIKLFTVYRSPFSEFCNYPF